MLLRPSLLGSLVRRDYQPAPHHLYLDSHFERIILGQQRRTILMEPVQHGKTQQTIFGIFAYLNIFPHKKVIFGTHTDSKAAEVGLELRDLFRDYGTRLTGVSLRSDSKSVQNFKLMKGGKPTGGGLMCVGVLSAAAMGRPAHLFVVDDSIGSHEQSMSPVWRNKVAKWFSSTVKTRLSRDGSILLMGTPWHSDDLMGRAIAAQKLGGDRWVVVRMPALWDGSYGDVCPLGRADGDPLWPSRWDKSALEAIRSDKGATGNLADWHALYQCRPLLGSGDTEWPESYFKDLWRPNHPEVICRVLALDPAKGKTKKPGCYQAIAELNLCTDGVVYVRSWLVRVPVEQLEDMVVHILNSKAYNGFIGEANGNQHVIINNIFRKFKSGRVPFFYMDNHVHKLIRIRLALGPLLAKNRLKLLEDGQSNRLLKEQLEVFPGHEFLDGPDACTLGSDLINHLHFGSQQVGLTLRVAG